MILRHNGSGAQVTFTVPGPLPGMNEFIDARARGYHTRRKGRSVFVNRYAEMKRKWSKRIKPHCTGEFTRLQLFHKRHGPAVVRLRIYEPNKRRDPDNVAAGAWKIILDAMQGEVLGGDGWRHVATTLVTTLDVDKENPRVDVHVEWGQM